MAETLFENQTTNVTGSAVNVPVSVQGGFLHRTIYITGTLDGATFKLQASPDGSVWVNVPDTDAVLPSPVNVIIRAKQLRGVLTGGGGSLSVTVKLY